jgi:hypothetical protein
MWHGLVLRHDRQQRVELRRGGRGGPQRGQRRADRGSGGERRRRPPPSCRLPAARRLLLPGQRGEALELFPADR